MSVALQRRSSAARHNVEQGERGSLTSFAPPKNADGAAVLLHAILSKDLVNVNMDVYVDIEDASRATVKEVQRWKAA
jgi:hypothetical protein